MDGTLDQDFRAIPKLEDLANMGPHVFTEIDNLVKNHNTYKAEITEEV